MSIFAGGGGYQGNQILGVSPGGGAFKYSEQPLVPGVYAGSCPGDPGCPGHSSETSGSTSWSEVGKQLVSTLATGLVSKYLDPPGKTAGNRTVPVNDKGQLGSLTERYLDPFWNVPDGERSRETNAGPSAAAPGPILIGLGLLAVVAVVISRRSRR